MMVYTCKGNVQCCVEVLSAELVKNDGVEALSHLRQLTLTQKLSMNTKQSEQILDTVYNTILTIEARLIAPLHSWRTEVHTSWET